jgi:phospholipase C
MKLAAKLLLLISLAATLAYAQNKPNTPFQHVIVVLQENRTPDNLFGSDAFATPHQLPGADLTRAGLCYNTIPYAVALQPLNLGNACDPYHGHEHAWIPTYNGGNMDGACKIGTAGCGTISYPEYTYVQSSDVVPYFQIAEQYGYANYMFQTNQGPSFPAHQFLLSGTSAPVYDDGGAKQYWQWFAAENATAQHVPYGCTASNTVILEVNPSGNESKGYSSGYPCYNHNTLVNLLDNPPSPIQTISWKYYSQSGPTGLWTAPNAIAGICGLSGGSCMGSDWQNYVESVFPNSPGYPNSYSPILTDLGADPAQPQCTLPAVSWVVPDGSWSDHGGLDPHGAGPSWVAAIVNAVGGYDDATGGWLPTNCGYWANTVILITWDDWGGFYDHVLPWNCNTTGTCTGYNNGAGGVGGEYVYGFRVPLLVVSAYTGTYKNGNWSGYISGACGSSPLPPCPNEQQQYVHDFGSILNFIEYAFGQNKTPIGYIYPQYNYADYYAPDGPNTGCNSTVCPYSLYDFFQNGFTNPRTFTAFTQGINYRTECFITPKAAHCFGSNFTPSDPDADAVDLQD